MSAADLIQRAKFLVDNKGNTTGVLLLLDIHDWESLIDSFKPPLVKDADLTLPDPAKNPLLTEFAGSVSMGDIASNIDDELYGPIRVR